VPGEKPIEAPVHILERLKNAFHYGVERFSFGVEMLLSKP